MALVSGMLSLSSAKMSQAAMNANGSSSIAMQAGAYASGKAEILQKEGYSDLKNQGKLLLPIPMGFTMKSLSVRKASMMQRKISSRRNV